MQTLTRQLSTLDIQSSSKPPNQSVSKLLSKYGAPNPFNPPKPTSSLRSKAYKPAQPSSNLNPHTVIDIGKYDGGLERDLNEKRGLKVYGEAAEELALDSSVSKSVLFPSFCFLRLHNPSQEKPNPRMVLTRI
jgi:hypothetical protein